MNCHAEPADVSSEALAKEEASRRRRVSDLGNMPFLVAPRFSLDNLVCRMDLVSRGS